MPRVALAPQQAVRTGLQPAYTAAEVAGNSFNNSGREVLHIKNGATACVATLVLPATVDGQAVTDPTVTIPAAEERMIGPFPPGLYNQGGSIGDVVHVDYNDVANVTVAVVRL